MSILRRAFLFCVGAVALAYEELSKPIQKQRDRLNERFGHY
jgi:hypothetical protein